jgi:hypothetical protein
MRLSKPPSPVPFVVVAAAVILSAPVYFQRGDTVSGVYANAIMSAQAATTATKLGDLAEFRDIAAESQLWWTRMICLLRRHASRI